MAESDKHPVPAAEDPATVKRPSRSRRASAASQIPATADPATEETATVRQAADIEAEPNTQSGSLTVEEGVTGSINDPVAADIEAVIVEAAVTPEFEILEEIAKEELETLNEVGEEELEATESAASSLAEAFWTFTTDAASYSKESLDVGSELYGELLRAKSPATALQIQADYAKSAYVRFLKHLLKMNRIYWKLVEEALKPVGRGTVKAEA
jgi:hypothetical protein